MQNRLNLLDASHQYSVMSQPLMIETFLFLIFFAKHYTKPKAKTVGLPSGQFILPWI